MASDVATAIVASSSDGQWASLAGAAYFYSRDSVFADGFDGLSPP